MKKTQLKQIIREILEDESPGRMRDMHKDLQDINHKRWAQEEEPDLSDNVLDSFKSEEGNGIHLTGFSIGDVYLTLSPYEHEEMAAEPVTTNQGVIDVNGQKLYYSVGSE